MIVLSAFAAKIDEEEDWLPAQAEREITSLRALEHENVIRSVTPDTHVEVDCE
jgi:hypothetical protein